MPYYTYILASKTHGTLYVGVTNNIERRIAEHKANTGGQFTSKYTVHNLVYFEEHADPASAIAREKQLKSGSRKKKIELIESINPKWLDLINGFE